MASEYAEALAFSTLAKDYGILRDTALLISTVGDR
jgi:hypothetical protein